MKKRMMELDTWTTDELLTEVLSRNAGNRPALNRIQVTTMRAVLNDCDQKAIAASSQTGELAASPSTNHSENQSL
jgi:hypothetical protein